MTSETMRGVVLEVDGDPDVLRVQQVPLPSPGPGDVRIRLAAASINHLDLWIRKGMPSVPKPRIMGADGVGVVDALGVGVDAPMLGRRVLLDPGTSCGQCDVCTRGDTVFCRQFAVLGEHRAGTHAEAIVVPARNALAVPAHLDDRQAAALPLAFATAYRMLHGRAALQAGERVLVWGASSGVGTAAVQLARAMGAEVIATSRSADKRTALAGIGAHHVVDSVPDEVVAAARELTDGRGVDVIFDHLGELSWTANLQAVRPGGRITMCGATTGANPPAMITRLFWKQVSVLGSTMANAAEVADMVRLVELHGIVPIVDARAFSLDDVAEAHRYVEAARQFGKVVLDID